MKKLINNIIATLILIFSVYLLYYGIPCLINSHSLANSLGTMPSEFMDDAFNKTDWTIRWILSTGFFSLWGLVGIVGALGLFRNKHWASLVCLFLYVAIIVWEAIYTIPGVAKYTWEFTGWKDFLITFCVCLLFCIYFFLKHKSYIIDAEQRSASGQPGHSGFEKSGEWNNQNL